MPHSIRFSRIAVLCLACVALACTANLPGLNSGDEAGTQPPEAKAHPALDRYLQSRTADQDTSYYRPYVAVLPFVDESGFRRGIWEVQEEFARFFTAAMEGKPGWRVVPYDAVQEVAGEQRRWRSLDVSGIGQQLQADIVVAGTLLDLNMERLHVGDPLVGGYKSYKGTAEMEVTAYGVADGGAVGTVHGREETTDRGLGLDLLGKPREQDYQFVNLDQMAFGSDEFRQTAIGQAVVITVDEVVEKLADKLRPEGVELEGEGARILSVYGDEVFINLGSEHAVRRGHRFTVVPGAERRLRDGLDAEIPVGVVEVLDVVGARVSRVRSLGDVAQMEAGDELRQIEQTPAAAPAVPDSAGAGGK